MPFAKAQSVLKVVLPKSWFDSLYNVACNGFDIYQKVADNTFYIPSFVYYTLRRDKEKLHRINTIQRVLPYTMTSKVGVTCTYDVASLAVRNGVEGAFVECGVARGGCSALMALIAQDEGLSRKTWLFDSFEGLPIQSEKDGVQKPIRHKERAANDLVEGYCLGTYDEVYNLLYGKLRLDHNRVFMAKGWFQDTLPKHKEEIGIIAVLRLDADWYESIKCCLENLYDNVAPNGYVIIDDYQLIGCKLAVDEFLGNSKLKPIMRFDANGRAYWRKL